MLPHTHTREQKSRQDLGRGRTCRRLPSVVLGVIVASIYSNHYLFRLILGSQTLLDEIPASFDSKESWFWEKANNCHAVDDVCHVHGQDDLQHWFYFAREIRDHQRSLKQPSLAIIRPHHGIQFKLSSTPPKQTLSQLRTLSDVRRNCSLSNVMNHVVIQSSYNDMIGEFYARSLLPLSLMMYHHDSPSVRTEYSANNLQFYIHLLKGEKLLDAHELFLSALPSNNKVRLWGDTLFEEPEGDSECRCFKRFVFCGYRPLDIGGSGKNSSLHEGPKSSDERAGTEEVTLVGDGSINLSTGNTCEFIESTGYERCEPFAWLRMFLLQSLSRKHRALSRDLDLYRSSTLREVMDSLPASSESSNASHHHNWTFIGLAQRKKRRIWMNLEQVLDHCNSQYHLQKIVCVEVNVETLASGGVVSGSDRQGFYRQLAVHHSLDALIGVHGAQLTQAVLLSKGAAVVELLPWAPQDNYFGTGRKVWGGWVQKRHEPTPLGVIYHNTDLNHVGYPLGRESVPLCDNVSNTNMHYVDDAKNPEDRRRNETELEYCLHNQKPDTFTWDRRNFNVGIDMIDRFIRNFVLTQRKGTSSTCETLRQHGEKNNFVLYNVWCRENSSSSVSLHHFYQN